MAKFRAEKVVAALPDPLEANTVYYVRTGDGFDIYVSDATGSVAHALNAPGGAGGFEIGQALLTAKGLTMTGWLPMDGSQYTSAAYPDLASLIGGVATFATSVAGLPTIVGSAYSADFTDNMALLAVGHHGTSQYVTVLNVSNWSEITVPQPTSTVYCVDFNAAGTYLAVGALNPMVYDTDNWSFLPGIPTVSGGVRDLTFSPDGSVLAVGHKYSPRLTLIETSTWTAITHGITLNNVSATGKSLLFSPDGSLLYAARSNGGVGVIETTGWTLERELVTNLNAGQIALSPDGNFLFITTSSSPYYALIDTRDWTEVTIPLAFSTSKTGCFYSPDGGFLAVTSLYDPVRKIYKTDDWSEVAIEFTFHSSRQDNGLFFSPDGSYAASLGNDRDRLIILDVEDTSVMNIPEKPAPRSDFEWRIKAEDVS